MSARTLSSSGRLVSVPAANPRVVALAFLLGAICVSPRIPIPIFVPGRRFDLRLEDLVLVALLLLIVTRRISLDLRIDSLFIAISAYVLVCLTSSILAVTLDSLSPL